MLMTQQPTQLVVLYHPCSAVDTLSLYVPAYHTKSRHSSLSDMDLCAYARSADTADEGNLLPVIHEPHYFALLNHL